MATPRHHANAIAHIGWTQNDPWWYPVEKQKGHDMSENGTDPAAQQQSEGQPQEIQIPDWLVRKMGWLECQLAAKEEENRQLQQELWQALNHQQPKPPPAANPRAGAKGARSK